MTNNNSDNKKRKGFTVYVASWIHWESKQGTFGFSIWNNTDNSLFYRDYLCEVLGSPSEGEIKALINALPHIPLGEPVLLKSSQSAVVTGINYNLPEWERLNWRTKEDNPVKNKNEWSEIYNLISQGRKILAVQIQDDEFNSLQNGCRKYLSFFENV